MAEIVVIGGGIAGSTAALLLARDGHSITLLDRDPGPLPADVDEAWSSWNRRAVGQFRLPHILLARATSILADEVPDVASGLERAGCRPLNLVDEFAPTTGWPDREPDDDRFTMITGRRPTIEWVLAKTLDAEPRISVRRGAAVDELIAGPPAAPGIPHVVGVRLHGGEAVRADLVVDATGRNSPVMRWLAELGDAAPREVIEDSGFAYYARFYRSADGSTPELRSPILTPYGSMSVLTIPSDNGTWSVMVYASSGDKPLRRLRQPEVFEAVLGECPLHNHWLDGEPISEMMSMVGVTDRRRSFLVDGQPVVTGLLSIGDARACSNPSLGRGISFALMHTVVLRDAVRKWLDEPVALSREFGREGESTLDPWHEATRDIDRSRIEEMRAAAEGRIVEDTPQRQIVAAFETAIAHDLTALRAWSEVLGCLTPVDQVLARDGLVPHVIGVASTAPTPPPGPSRARLIELTS